MNSTESQIGNSWWRWIVGGALYGVLLRVLFGALPHSVHGVMSVAFLVGTPFVVGALTIYGMRNSKQGVEYWIIGPWATVALMLAGCAVTLLEGSICLALLAPLFLVCASVGGIVMGLAMKLAKLKGSHLKVVAVLPFLILIGEGRVPLRDRELELRQSVNVSAAPATVWKQIMTARSIHPDELPFSLVHFIGVPRPVEGINVATPDGEIRYSKWERGVKFHAVVKARRENESISWQYVFDPHSFPAGSMDEHVAIGGRYFDLRDTTFNLRGLPGGQTQLEIVAHYRVTSSINFYAVPAAKLLGRDFINTILILYKNRSEQAEARNQALESQRGAKIASIQKKWS